MNSNGGGGANAPPGTTGSTHERGVGQGTRKDGLDQIAKGPRYERKETVHIAAEGVKRAVQM